MGSWWLREGNGEEEGGKRGGKVGWEREEQGVMRVCAPVCFHLYSTSIVYVHIISSTREWEPPVCLSACVQLCDSVQWDMYWWVTWDRQGTQLRVAITSLRNLGNCRRFENSAVRCPPALCLPRNERVFECRGNGAWQDCVADGLAVPAGLSASLHRPSMPWLLLHCQW